MSYWQEIFGYFDNDIASVYAERVLAAPQNAVFVEVGALFGQSTLFMAECMRDARRTDIDLHVVDTWQEWGEPHPQEIAKYGSMFGAFCYHLQESGLKDYVKGIHHMDSSEAVRQFRYLGPRPDFVFIDGDHEYASVQRDIAEFRSIMAPGAVMAGHDYNPPRWPGVVRAVNDVFPHRELVGQCWRVRL